MDPIERATSPGTARLGAPRLAPLASPIPIWQLAIRFALEIGSLLAIGAWLRAWSGWALALGVPVVLSMIWGTLAVKGDPSRSGNAPVPVHGLVRLAVELGLFCAGALALVGHWPWFAAFAVAFSVHHLGTLPRIRWLIRGGRSDEDSR